MSDAPFAERIVPTDAQCDEMRMMLAQIYAAARQAMNDPAYALTLNAEPSRPTEAAFTSAYVHWLRAAARQIVPADCYEWAVTQTLGGGGFVSIIPIMEKTDGG